MSEGGTVHARSRLPGDRLVLFTGAHPDDIELGAGGTASLLAFAGWDVRLCVLTDEASPSAAETRRREALEAARVMGVPKERVLFAGFPDGSLSDASDATCRLGRSLGELNDGCPVVFTHSGADRHPDHNAARAIVLRAFPTSLVLQYAVVNSLIREDFRPRLVVDVSRFWETKLLALRRHSSQVGRIRGGAVTELAECFGSLVGAAYAEAFEVDSLAAASIYEGVVAALGAARLEPGSVDRAKWYDRHENVWRQE